MITPQPSAASVQIYAVLHERRHRRLGQTALAKTIAGFADSIKQPEVAALCEDVYTRMVSRIQSNYANRFLASLFKNPTLTKDVFEHSLQ